jgi:hypothetical protein
VEFTHGGRQPTLTGQPVAWAFVSGVLGRLQASKIFRGREACQIDRWRRLRIHIPNARAASGGALTLADRAAPQTMPQLDTPDLLVVASGASRRLMRYNRLHAKRAPQELGF